MSSSSWDRQSSSWRTLALVVALTVAAATLVPGGWASLRPGSAQAQVTDDSPPEESEDGDVSEFLEAAKLGALASGNVIAGPGQVLVTRTIDLFKDGPVTLWQFDNGRHYASRPLKHVTLTVQKLGACHLFFTVHHADRTGESTNTLSLNDFDHQSSSISHVRAFKIDYRTDRTQTIEEPCLFLWVLRETQPDA